MSLRVPRPDQKKRIPGQFKVQVKGGPIGGKCNLFTPKNSSTKEKGEGKFLTTGNKKKAKMTILH